jgi:hypothetical protein
MKSVRPGGAITIMFMVSPVLVGGEQKSMSVAVVAGFVH